MTTMHEHDFEAVPGLPERLPGQERVLWQGCPRWGALARRAFHVRAVVLYFLALGVWSGASASAEGAGAGALALDALWLALVASLPVGTLLLLSALAARTTLYTVTDRRLVLRVGMALPMAVNIPLGAVRSAGLRRCADGTGDIALDLMPDHRVSFVALWPHAKPWRFRRPEPLLRGLPDPDAAARALASALAASTALEPAQAAAPVKAPAKPRPEMEPAAAGAAA